jgi:hypothetical protein
MQLFRSEHIVVTIQAGALRHKVFQVFFGRDRSLFVTFPYFKHPTGILASATIPGNGQTTSEVDLQVGGKIASHLVKYSHHPDGRAHFSQHGRVRTEIKRQSIALDRQQGHIFSLIVQGLGGFHRADDVKDVGSTRKRTTLTFQIGSAEAEAIKFVAHWYGASDSRVEQQQNGFLVASPYDNARHVLFLTCYLVPRLGPVPEMMLFYGGLAAREVMNDTTKDAGFLAFLYPASNAEDLAKSLGRIDL